MNQYDFYENAAVRMLDRHRFPLPWHVEEAPSCFVVRDHNGHAFAHVYYDDKLSTKLPTRAEARRIAAKGRHCRRELLRHRKTDQIESRYRKRKGRGLR